MDDWATNIRGKGVMLGERKGAMKSIRTLGFAAQVRALTVRHATSRWAQACIELPTRVPTLWVTFIARSFVNPLIMVFDPQGEIELVVVGRNLLNIGRFLMRPHYRRAMACTHFLESIMGNRDG